MRRSPASLLRAALFVIPFLPLDLAAQQTGSIAGIVQPEEGASIAGAGGIPAVQVQALRENGGVAASVLTDEAGAYRLFVAPGTYTVEFSTPGWRTLGQPGVVVRAGEVTQLSVQLEEQVFELNPITITASKTEEKAIEAPAAVEVVSTLDIAEQPAMTVADHVRNIAAVDVIKSGLQGNYVVVRGFNNIFSGATLTLTDNRIASVPSLRANVLHLNPTTNPDIERVEVVLGPGSALYGPNAANGVIHSITKSPIDYPGGLISIAGGIRQQDDFSGTIAFDVDDDDVDDVFDVSYDGGAETVFHIEGRYALRTSERFGIKLSGQYFMGEEFQFIDPQEFEAATFAVQCQDANYFPGNSACQGFMQGLDFTGDPGAAAQTLRASVDNVAGGRDNALERFSGELRADWRPTEELGFIVSGGRTQAVNSVDLTGLGGAQVDNWGYHYGQVRALWRDAFAQVFFNQSDNNDSYLLQSGRPLVDRSTLLVTQLQNSSMFAGSKLVYGADFLFTNPQTEGTINGSNEEDDKITEFGGYLQSQTPLSDHFELMLAARVDKHSVLEDLVFSPRAAVVWTPTQGQSFRATYNRAFSTPSTLNLFLDISGASIDLRGPRYDVRAQGTTRDGLHFNFGGNGLPMHRNPFAALTGFGTPTDWQPTTIEHVWDEIVAVIDLGSDDDALVAFLESLNPTENDIAIDARTLNISEERFDLTPGGIDNLSNVPRLDPTITNTYELGYKGLVGDRLLLGANGYYTRIDDFTSALRIATPNVFLRTEDVEAFLAANGMPAAQANAVARTIGGNGTSDSTGIPVGVMSMVEAGGTDAALILTYQNLGRVDLFGADVSATVIVSNNWELDAGLAWINDDQFVANEGTPSEETIPLNAPTFKATGSVRYRNLDTGINGQVRGRYVNGFPANSGVYSGDVDGYTTFDLTAGYRLPFMPAATLTLDVQNVLDTGYQTFVGTPELGRISMLRLMYEF